MFSVFTVSLFFIDLIIIFSSLNEYKSFTFICATICVLFLLPSTIDFFLRIFNLNFKFIIDICYGLTSAIGLRI